jgi:SPP1 gp7 family putative phage head morphogenesis protein
MPEFISKPVPNTEAARFIREKPVVSQEVFRQLLPDLQARAFTIAGVENANVMQNVRDLIAGVPRGTDWDKVKGEIADQLSPYLGDGANRRAELLLRQHGYQSYQAAQYEVMDRQRAAFPYWQYQSAEDDRVRESHAALNGVVMPADSPFWDAHYPPWDWGCRCYVVPLTEDDVAEMQRADANLPIEQRRVLDVDQQQRLENSGVVQRAPDGGVPRPINVTPKPDAPRFDPQSLRMGADQLRGRYDAETWAVFERWAKGQAIEIRGEQVTIWDWMNVRPRGAGRPRARRVAPASPSAAPTPRPEPVRSATPPAFDARAVEAEREAIRRAAYTNDEFLGGGVNRARRLTNGRKVVFKPGSSEYSTADLRPGIRPGTQYPREVAVSLLDDELGLGLVPPTTLLRWKGEEGSAQLWKDGFKPGWSFGADLPRLMGRLPVRVQQDWRLLDDLIANTDRHGRNFMLRVAGARGAETVELALIDNGLSLSPQRMGPRWFESSYAPLGGAPIDAVNLARLEQLLAREGEIREKLKQLVPEEALTRMFLRARRLLTKKTYGDID